MSKVVVSAVVLGAAGAGALYLAGGSPWVYYYSVDEFSKRAEHGEWEGNKGQLIRLAGSVKEGSVVHDSGGQWIEFGLEGDAACVKVRHRGMVPANFSEGKEVVVEGGYGGGELFASDKILTRCESKYKVKLKERSSGRTGNQQE